MKGFTLIRNVGIGLILLTFAGGGIGVSSANAHPVLKTPVQEQKQNLKREALLSHEVRRQLRAQIQSYSGSFNVFDDVQYQIRGSHVILMGKVLNPMTRSSAGRAVRNIRGVTQVVNKIQVLPLSSVDNQIRWAEYRSIFSEPSLQRYSMGTVPSIHIIVDQGKVTLVGYVDNKMDRELAGMRARMVAGVFSVKNDLHVS